MPSDSTPAKLCVVCGKTFTRLPSRYGKQWQKQIACSRECGVVASIQVRNIHRKATQDLAINVERGTLDLGGGLVAEFDAIDLPVILAYTWHPYTTPRHRSHYVVTYCGGRRAYLHRVLLGFPDGMIDHRDGNGLNNKRSNLRICQNTQNMANARKPRISTSSRYKGVHWHRQGQKWRASINAQGHVYSLGVYENEEDAARAYDDAARLYHGEFARLNFPAQDEQQA